MYAYPFKNCTNTCRTYFTTLYIEYAPTLIRDPICSELPLPGGDLSMTLVQQCTHLRILRQILSFSSGFFLQNSSAKLVYLCGGETSSLRVGSYPNSKTKKVTRDSQRSTNRTFKVTKKKGRSSDWESAGKNETTTSDLQPFHLFREGTEESCPRLVLALTSARCSNRKPEGHKSQRFDGGWVGFPIWDFIFAGVKVETKNTPCKELLHTFSQTTMYMIVTKKTCCLAGQPLQPANSRTLPHELGMPSGTPMRFFGTDQSQEFLGGEKLTKATFPASDAWCNTSQVFFGQLGSWRILWLLFELRVVWVSTTSICISYHIHQYSFENVYVCM